MNNRMFVVVIDVTDPTVDNLKIKDLLKNSKLVRGWWHHIPGCYLLTSEADADRLTDEFRTVTGDARLLIMAADPVSSEGWLPEKSWQWIKKRQLERAE